MGFSLRNWFEEATAQINPFDKGKTAKTVRAQRQAPSPAQTRPAANNNNPKGPMPSYGSGLGAVINRGRDVLDANTPQDYWKRNQEALQERRRGLEEVSRTNEKSRRDALANNQTSYKILAKPEAPKLNQSYRDQQIAQGNKRPYQNIGAALAGGTARMDNTFKAALRETADTALMYGAQATGNNKAYKAINEANQRFKQKAYQADSGALGQGTIFDNPEQFNTLGAKDITKRTLATAGQAGLEIMPLTKGAGLTANLLSKAPNAAARTGMRFTAGAIEGGAQDVLEQQITRDHFSPEQTFMSAATGGLMANIGPAIGRITRSGKKVTTGLVNATPLDEVNIKQPTNSLGLKPLNQDGFVQVGRTPKKIHPEDKNIMSDFIDMQRGTYKPDSNTAFNLELDASHIAERYGLDMPSDPKKLANVFDQRLTQEGFGKQPTTKLVSATPLDEANVKQPTTSRAVKLSEFENALIPEGLPKAQREAIVKQLNSEGIQPRFYKNGQRQQALQDLMAEDNLKRNPTSIDKNQGGYVGLPGGKKDLTPTSQPSVPKSPFEADLEQANLKPTKNNKPKGFILKETKPRAGRVDTVRIKNDKAGLARTIQSEPSLQAKEYAETFGVTPEKAAQDLGEIEKGIDLSGTTKAMDKVKNSRKKNLLKDMQDQADYGVKEIQEKPKNTIDSVVNKYLNIEELDDAALDVSSPKYETLGKVQAAREKVRSLNVTRIAHDKLAKGLEKLSRGGRVARRINRVVQYINKNAGQDPDMIKAAQKYAGDNSYADSSLLKVGKQAYDLLGDETSRARVHAVLDPEGSGAAVKFADLSDNEKQAVNMLRDLGDAINDTSYRTGFISKKKWESNRGGRYIARLYRDIASSEDVADLLEMPDKRGLHLGMYKSRVEMNDALRQKLIRDPVKLAVIRARQVRQNEALLTYMMTAEGKGYVSATPKGGFVKVTPQNRMANWSGKYVRQDVFENIEGFRAMGEGMNAMNNLLDLYDGNPLRRMRKKMLTIYNPVVRAGNVTTSYFFAYLNGINPATYQNNKFWASKALKNDDPLALAAQRQGLIGNDIVRTDKNIFDKDKAFFQDLDRNTSGLWDKTKDAPREIDGKLSLRYGQADDIAKLAALKSHVNRGLSVNEAIAKTRKGFQDYSRVGHGYDMAAKMPIFGNAFVRFQGDLYTSILKNAAIDHPLRLGAMIAGIAALGNGLSSLSGETVEDKKTREDRAGAPKIPFTNVSTEFQTPYGAVDAARFTPLYMRQDIDGNSLADNLSRLAPVNIPSNLSKEEIVKKAATDPLIGPVISAVGDVDWRGKSVSDPDGVRKGKELFPDDKLSEKDKWRNRLQYGVRSYAPYPVNEVGDILSAVNQNKRNEQAADGSKYDPSQKNVDFLGRTGFNTSGSKKSVGQAAWRLLGVRAQKFGAEESKEKRKTDKMFGFFGEVDKFKATLDDTTRKSFETRHKSNQTRSGLMKEFTEDPWYKYKNAGELLQNPALFKAEEKYARMQNKYDKRPVDPVFNLNKARRDIILAKKLKLPGSKDEGFNTLYDKPWYQDFRNKQDKYYKSKGKYTEARGFADIKDTNPYPETKADVRKHMDHYFKLPSGTGERSSFIRNNPAIWEQITGQWDKQNKWTDRERKKLGLPKIKREESDNKYSAKGSGKGGYARGGGSGSRSDGRSLDDFKQYGFGNVGSMQSSSKSLRQLVEDAVIKKPRKA